MDDFGPTRLELLEEKVRKFVFDDIKCQKGVREAIARGEAIRPEVEKLRASGDFEGAQAMLSEATRWPENWLTMAFFGRHLPGELKQEQHEWQAMTPSTPHEKRERDHALIKLEALGDVLLNLHGPCALNRGIPAGVLPWVDLPSGAEPHEPEGKVPEGEKEALATQKVGPSASETPEVFVVRLQKDGMTDLRQLAGAVDKRFIKPDGSPLLSDPKLGKLLPANPGTILTYEGNRSQGKRLRGKI